jgi:hypothetical protein
MVSRRGNTHSGVINSVVVCSVLCSEQERQGGQVASVILQVQICAGRSQRQTGPNLNLEFEILYKIYISSEKRAQDVEDKAQESVVAGIPLAEADPYSSSPLPIHPSL